MNMKNSGKTSEMKDRKPRAKKESKERTRKKKPGNPQPITVPWGRGASEYRPGLFTKQYFVKHGESSCADVFAALREDLRQINQLRAEIGETPIRGCTYNSFAKYWHWFKILGLIEQIGRSEDSVYDFLKPKQFYQLTERGKLEVKAWEDPVRVAHPEFD